MDPLHPTPKAHREPFPNTVTQVLRDAQDRSRPEEYEAAWKQLIDAYSHPLAVCLRTRMRRLGREADDQLLSELIFYVYSRNALEGYDRSKSKFRSFLQGVVTNFVREKLRELQRHRLLDDPGEQPIEDIAESARQEEMMDAAWATTVLEQSLAALQGEQPDDARLLIDSFGLAGRPPVDRSTLARLSNRTENAVSSALYAAKDKLRQLIFRELRAQCSYHVDFVEERTLLIEHLRRSHPNLRLASDGHGAP